MKLIAAVVLFLVCSSHISAEETMHSFASKDSSKKKEKTIPLGQGASAKGNFVIQPALNFGHHLGFGKVNYGGAAYGSGLVPGVTLNLDYNVHDYVSIGAFYGASFKNYKTADVFYLAHVVGVRGAFHWWQMLDDKLDADLFSSNIDFDVHAHIGAYLAYFKNKTTGVKTKAKGVNAGGGIAMRYYFVKHFGVALEFGYEEGAWGKLGFSIKI